MEFLNFRNFNGKYLVTIFGSVQPKSECNFSFLYNLIFQPYHLSSPLALLRAMPKKFYLKLFFGIMCIFGSVQLKSECNFPFLYKNIKHITIHCLSWLENGGRPYLYNSRALDLLLIRNGKK